MSCPFCDIVRGEEPATIVREWGMSLAIVPLVPVVEGHLLVFPKTHVRDAIERPAVSAFAMHAASEIAQRPCNIITSIGSEATQTVEHLHLHVVPRREGDGLKLPWG